MLENKVLHNQTLEKLCFVHLTKKMDKVHFLSMKDDLWA